jgi:hypothetical protein
MRKRRRERNGDVDVTNKKERRDSEKSEVEEVAENMEEEIHNDESACDEPGSAWPRFLIVEGEGLEAVPHLRGVRSLRELVGGVTKVTRHATGSLLVEVASREAATQLMAVESLCGCGVQVTPHRARSVRGVITCREILRDEVTDICEELAAVGVVKVERIHRKVDGVSTPTPTLILTFSGELPKEGYVRVGFLRVRVRPYIRNPLLCYKCFRFGHVQAKCRGIARCGRCGSSDHDNDRECTLAMKCRNCSGEHSAFSRDCPAWLREKAIQKVIVKENVPFFEAARRVVRGTYAAAAARGTAAPVDTAQVAPQREAAAQAAPQGRVAACVQTAPPMRSFGTQTEIASKDAWVQTSTCEEEEEAEEENLTSEDEDENTHMSDEQENEEKEPPSEDIEDPVRRTKLRLTKLGFKLLEPSILLGPEEYARQSGGYVLKAYSRDIQRTPLPAGYKRDHSWSPVKYP